jgi:methylglyoxal synthase
MEKMLIQERFKSPDKVFEKVYGIFDKRDYFNVKGLAKVQIGNFERALQKNDKGAQQILDKFKGDEKKAKEYIIQVIHDRKKEQAFEAFKAFKSAVNKLEMVSKGKSKEAYGASDLVKSRIHNNSQKYTIALYSAIRGKKFNNKKDVHADVDDLLAKNEGFSSDAQRKAAFANGYEEKDKKNEGKKRFKRQDGIGKAKYTISYHDGKKKHKDGSDFFDIKIFKNKKDLSDFVGTLVKQGYKLTRESVNEGISVSDERHFGKKGIIIMIDDNGKKVSAIFKDKKNADKFNRNNPSDIKKLLQLAKKTKYPKAIDESVNEILVIVDKFDKRKQDYGKVYYQDGGRRPGDGDINKAQKEFDKLSKKHKGLTLISVDRNSKMYDVNESVNEGKAFVVMYKVKKDLPNRNVKPTSAAYAKESDAKKFLKSIEKDGGKGMIVKSNVRGIKEDKNQIIQIKKKVGNSETKFYDTLSTIEKKLGKRKYRIWLEQSLKSFGENPKHYDYRTNASIEEKLFQVAK